MIDLFFFWKTLEILTQLDEEESLTSISSHATFSSESEMVLEHSPRYQQLWLNSGIINVVISTSRFYRGE